MPSDPIVPRLFLELAAMRPQVQDPLLPLAAPRPEARTGYELALESALEGHGHDLEQYEASMRTALAALRSVEWSAPGMSGEVCPECERVQDTAERRDGHAEDCQLHAAIGELAQWVEEGYPSG